MSTPKPLEFTCSRHFLSWLQEQKVSLAFTTYQTNRLFLIGLKPNGQLSGFERLFDRAMGLWATPNHLYLSTRYQFWQFDNVLNPGQLYKGYDQLYVPRISYTTGDLDIHDLVMGKSPQQTLTSNPINVNPPPQAGSGDKVIFVNTLFSCLATLSHQYSFEPIWQPPFISKLTPEDRCHLNGLAMVEGKPRYVTAVSRSDVTGGWRERRQDGGVVMDIEANEIVASEFSMPHSPRFYQGKLWLLNSGTGEFGYLDLPTEKFQPVAFCPGYMRGLAFWRNYAVVGLSKPRDRSFSGLALDERLAAKDTNPRCGLMVIDLTTGSIAHWLELEGVVTELYDVQVLPGVRRPMALGFKSDEIARLVTCPGFSSFQGELSESQKSEGARQSPPYERSGGMGDERQNTEGKNQDSKGETAQPRVKYQLVGNLNPANTLQYDALTFPSIKKHWQTFQQKGILMGISASVAGEMVGLAIAEITPTQENISQAEVLSLFVLPEYRHQGIGTTLVKHLETALAAQKCPQVIVKYQATELTTSALEPLLRKRNWQPPKETFWLAKMSMEKIAQAPWLYKHILPDSFTIFPWSELTDAEKQQIQQTLDYPTSLSPFEDNSRLEPLNSLGLRYGDEVVGWMVTHRVAPDTIRYSTMFVAQRFQKLGRGVALIAEALKQQIASPVPNCTWGVAMENQQMVKFLRRRLAPYTTFISESRQSGKRLKI
ncbi:MAG: TIGR03032 family protein [Okeania sp. SIO2C9]|nr:TIGR03032 family protein [Okeania sp. SIO2C9]